MSRAKSLLSCLALTVLLGGCAPEDQRNLQNDLAATQAKFAAAWKSANEQARQLDTTSSKDDIEKALDSLHKQIIVASSQTGKQVDSVKAQIERLQLAEKVQDLKANADAKLKDLQELQDSTKKGIDV